MQFLTYLYNFLVPRSGQWSKVRRQHLLNNPICVVCGRKENLVAHHIVPFSLHPELELDPNNLITVCEGSPDGGTSLNCHFAICHLASWRSYNPNCLEDVKIWHDKIKNRP